MTKSSCINHPKREPITLIRRWHVQFCQGNKCAAALLNFYEYWHNVKLDIQSKNHRSNDIAEMYGDRRSQDESLLQFHTLDELAAGINDLFSKNTISAANKLLESLGVISIYSNPNPRYTFDKTNYILFRPEVCNRWLDEQYFDKNGSARDSKKEEIPARSEPSGIENSALVDRNADLGDRSPKSALSRLKFGTPYPKFESPSPKIGTYICKEITAEITNKEAAANELPENEAIKKQDVSAAAFFEEPAEEKIGEQLTPAQQHCVQQAVKKQALLPRLSLGTESHSPAEIQHAIEAEILNPNSFKKAHPNFLFKLNTIIAEAKRGRWSPSVVLQEVKKEEDDTKAREIATRHAKIQLLISECEGLKRDVEHIRLNHPDQTELATSIETRIFQLREEIKPLIQAVHALEQNTQIQPTGSNKNE